MLQLITKIKSCNRLAQSINVHISVFQLQNHAHAL